MKKSSRELLNQYFQGPPYPLFVIHRPINLEDPLIIPDLERALTQGTRTRIGNFLPQRWWALGIADRSTLTVHRRVQRGQQRVICRSLYASKIFRRQAGACLPLTSTSWDGRVRAGLWRWKSRPPLRIQNKQSHSVCEDRGGRVCETVIDPAVELLG
jgi:hypothetical protein